MNPEEERRVILYCGIVVALTCVVMVLIAFLG